MRSKLVLTAQAYGDMKLALLTILTFIMSFSSKVSWHRCTSFLRPRYSRVYLKFILVSFKFYMNYFCSLVCCLEAMELARRVNLKFELRPVVYDCSCWRSSRLVGSGLRGSLGLNADFFLPLFLI